MPLDPYVRRLIDVMALAGPRDPWSGSIRERRGAFNSLMSLSESDTPIGRVEDGALPGPGGPLPIRCYIPLAASDGRPPGLVYFHGGGLVAGSLDTHDALCRSLANETSCLLIAVDYRLAPEHRFPAALLDAHAATVWVFEHADVLRLNPARIAIAGDSAGATLAAAVCQLLAQASGPRPNLQLLLCPILDWAQETDSRQAFSEGYLINRATMSRDVECFMSEGVDATHPQISPLRVANVRGLPPAYIHTAEFDPFRDEGEAYAERLRLGGVEVHHTCHTGMVHLFYGLTRAIPYARTAHKQIGAEVRAALERTSGTSSFCSPVVPPATRGLGLLADAGLRIAGETE